MGLLSLLFHIVPILALLYCYIQKKYSYWSSRGVGGPKPSLLKLGNTLQIAGQDCPPTDEIALVQQHGKVYGTYLLFSPTLTVADPEVIKQVLVKDFNIFADRRQLNTYHELFNTGQLFAKRDDWKRIRAITGPSFTTGKLRAMVPIMNRSVEKLLNYFNNLANGTGVMTTREVMASFTINVIASAAYATETNTLEDGTSSTNPLVTNCLALGSVSAFQSLCFFAMPRWFNDLVGVRHVLNEKALDFMSKYIGAILQRRRSGHEKRTDLLQLLIDSSVSEEDLKNEDYAKLTADLERDEDDSSLSNSSSESPKSKRNQLTDTEITSQALGFFGAGFETTALTLTHIIFELSRHQDAQTKLIAELHDALDGLDANSAEYYDKLMGGSLPYLDATIKEALRMYPPLTRLERRCSQEGYKIAGITLAKDQLVEVSTYAVHYNPEYYPSPYQFNPDRFLPENKHLLVNYAYLPFGLGPRNCVGMRFAYQNIKLCLAKVFRQFSFHPTAQTPEKLQFDRFRFAVTSKFFETKVVRQ